MRLMTPTAPTGTEAGRAKRREEARLAAQKEMLEAQARRRLRRQRPIQERVQEAAEKLASTNVGTAIGLIEALGNQDQEIYILAETYVGKDRKQVKSQFMVPRAEVRDAYLRAVGVESPLPNEESS